MNPWIITQHNPMVILVQIHCYLCLLHAICFPSDKIIIIAVHYVYCTIKENPWDAIALIPSERIHQGYPRLSYSNVCYSYHDCSLCIDGDKSYSLLVMGTRLWPLLTPIAREPTSTMMIRLANWLASMYRDSLTWISLSKHIFSTYAASISLIWYARLCQLTTLVDRHLLIV